MEKILLLRKYRFFIFIAANILWIWALLSPNIYYFDDDYRAAGGFYNWEGDFRPFADYLYYILGLGRNFTDLTPFPQILALVFLYFSYFIYIRKFKETKIDIGILLVFLPIVWSPFLLANLYFRFDSIFMLLAILLAIIAIDFVDNKKYFKAIILLFLVCGLYQPSIIAYVCTSLFIIYKIDTTKNLKFYLIQSSKYFTIFLISILIYYFLIMKLSVSYNNYSSSHKILSIFNIKNNIIAAIKEILIIFKGDSGFIYLFIYLYLLLINLIFFIKKYSYIGLFFFTLINFIFIISAAGVNLLLSFPRFEYRTFIFHGFYLSFLLLSFYKIFYTGVYKKYFIILSSIVCFYFLSISLNVSNAQKSQSKFEEEIIFNLVNDIYKLKINNNKEFVFIGKSKVFNVDTLINKYPIIEYLVTHPVHYAYKIQKYYLYKLRIFTFNNKEQENNFWSNNNSNFILLIDGFFYKIYENETQVIIFLKEGSGENN